MTVDKIIGSGVFLFLDQLVFALAGWIYWFVITKFTTASEIGQATAVYSLIFLISMITQLGLEYPLLNRASAERSRILGSVIIIELAITLVAIPILIYLLNSVYPESFQSFTWLAVGILVLLNLNFVPRFALLGITEAKKILVIDTISTIIKFLAGLIFVTVGFGASGILSSFLIQAIVTTCVTLVLAIKLFGLVFGNRKYLAGLLKDGLVNMPSKLSAVLMFSLSVVLLASFGVETSDIGLFYIALMISLVAGSFASSLATMLIPGSSISKIDFSAPSMRIGISLTAPIIAALITSPKFILSIIGTQYVAAESTLIVLSIGILPFCIMVNAISKFNYLKDSRKLVLIGSIQLTIFVLFFFLLVPKYGILGAAFSILMAFTASAISSILWSEPVLIKYIVGAGTAIIAGWLTGITVGIIGGEGILIQISSILTAISVTFVLILAVRNTSTSEITQLIKSITNNTAMS